MAVEPLRRLTSPADLKDTEPMALIDDIEFYGRAVAAREMDRDTAAAALVAASSGGLTLQGAGTAIDKWQTARGQYEQAFSTAAATMDKIYGLDDIQP